MAGGSYLKKMKFDINAKRLDKILEINKKKNIF